MDYSPKNHPTYSEKNSSGLVSRKRFFFRNLTLKKQDFWVVKKQKVKIVDVI